MARSDQSSRLPLRQAIAEASPAVVRRDAETLLLHVLGRDRAWLLAHPEDELPGPAVDTWCALVRRRAAHEPLQYLTGHQEFFGLDLHITPDVLIPRPETEILVESVLAWAQLQGSLHIADVGTGSGAIALALAAHLPPATITALDISSAALAVAQANAVRLDLAHRVRFVQSNLLEALQPQLTAGTRFDAIVSNPPYVPDGDAPGMQPEVRDFEPHTALFAGADGLAIYRRLIPEAMDALRPGGLLALEFGYGQREILLPLLSAWKAVFFREDLANISRVALAIRP